MSVGTTNAKLSTLAPVTALTPAIDTPYITFFANPRLVTTTALLETICLMFRITILNFSVNTLTCCCLIFNRLMDCVPVNSTLSRISTAVAVGFANNPNPVDILSHMLGSTIFISSVSCKMSFTDNIASASIAVITLLT